MKKINKGAWQLLTDSAVRPGEPGSALAPEPVDSVHADAAVVAARGGGKALDEGVRESDSPV